MPRKQTINTKLGEIVSPAVRFGDLVFTSGMVGRDADGKLPPDVREQARLILERIKTTLEASGTSMDNVLEVSVWLSIIEDRPAFNGVYRTYFRADPPARTCVQAGSLGEDVLVEVSCVAGIPDK